MDNAHIQLLFSQKTIQLIHTHTLQSVKDSMKFGFSPNMLTKQLNFLENTFVERAELQPEHKRLPTKIKFAIPT
jgi:hypothetical protein